MSKISVIVPIYNTAPFLERGLNRLRQQTYKDLQIILVDDGSTDSSYSIAQKAAEMDSRITLLRIEHAGQSVARNHALPLVTGEFLSFVDADDYIPLDYYETLIAEIGNADILQFGYTRVNTEGRIISYQLPRHPYQFTTIWSRLYRRACVEGIMFEPGMYYEDVLYSVDLWLRKPTIKMLQYAGYQYTLNPNSTTAQRHQQDENKVMEKLRQRGLHFICLFTQLRLFFHFLRIKTSSNI